jgi:hypothetical protein
VAGRTVLEILQNLENENFEIIQNPPSSLDWLNEAPEAPSGDRIEVDANEFTRQLEEYLEEDSDCSSENEEEWEEDPEMRKYFDEMENEIQKLRIGETCFDDFMKSMESEGGDQVGPASVIFSEMFKRRKE